MANVFDQFDQDVAAAAPGGRVSALPNQPAPATTDGSDHGSIMEEAGQRWGIPQGLMSALMSKESGGKPGAVSSKGAIGLGQVMPATAQGMGYNVDELRNNPAMQADASAQYLSQMYNRYGDWRLALQAYHDGPGNTDAMLKGEYTPGPEGANYVDSRFDQWTNGGANGADSTNVTQHATSAKTGGNVFDQFGDYSPARAQENAAPAEQANSAPTATGDQPATAAQPAGAEPSPYADYQRTTTLGEDLADAGKGFARAATNVLNIPIDVANMTQSGVAWLANELGIGDGTYTPIPRGGIPGITGDQDMSEGARLGADLISGFATLPAGGAGTAARAPAIARELAELAGTASPEVASILSRLGGFVENRIAAPAARATPGAIAASGGDEDKAAIGVALGPVAEGAVNLAAAGARAAAPAVRNIVDSIRPTPAAGGGADDAVNAVNSAAQDVGNAARASQRPGAATTTVDDITAPTAAVDLARRADVDQDLVRAADELGITDDLTPGLFMQNKSVRDVLANIRSRDGSSAQEAFGKQYRALQDQAAKVIDDMGGKVDDMTFDSTFNSTSKAVIDRLGAAKEKAYSESLKQIPPATPVNVDNSLNHLWQRADEVGQQWLLPLEKEALERLQPTSDKVGGATFNRLDDLRRKVGDAMSNYQTGSNERRLLGQLYSRLTDDQGQVAAQFGVADRWQQAKRLNQLWVAAQTRMRAVLGKDLDSPKSVTNRIYGEVRKLGTPGGDPKGFRDLMDKTPKSLRGDVARQALGAAFKGGQRSGADLDVAGFARWYNEARNSGKLGELTRYLPEDVNKRLTNFAKITAAARREAEGFKATGKISELDQRLGGGSNKALDRLFNTRLGTLALQGAATMLPGGAGNIMAEVARQAYAARPAAVEVADKFMSSGALNQAIRIVARGGTPADADRVLSQSPSAREFIESLTPRQRANVARVGLMGWLATPLSAAAQEDAQEAQESQPQAQE